jgi:hypothetical protein
MLTLKSLMKALQELAGIVFLARTSSLNDDTYTEFSREFNTGTIVRRFFNGDGAWNVTTATGM